MTATLLIAFFALVIGVPVVLANRDTIRRARRGRSDSRRHRSRHRDSATPFLILPLHGDPGAERDLIPAWSLSASAPIPPSRFAPDVAEREVPVEQLPGFADVADSANGADGIADRSVVARSRPSSEQRQYSRGMSDGEVLPQHVQLPPERAD